MLTKSINMTKELQEYLLRHNPGLEDELLKLIDTTDSMKYGRLRSPTEQIHFILFLIKLLKPKSILEVGTFTGCTTLAMALVMGEKAKIVTCDINAVFPKIGIPYWERAGVMNRIKLMLGPATNTLDQLIKANQLFDFIYIDADKENNLSYLNLGLDLLEPNGLIIVDNTLVNGEVTNIVSNNTKAMALRKFNTEVKNYPNIDYCLTPLCDGITLIKKK